MSLTYNNDTSQNEISVVSGYDLTGNNLYEYGTSDGYSTYQETDNKISCIEVSLSPSELTVLTEIEQLDLQYNIPNTFGALIEEFYRLHAPEKLPLPCHLLIDLSDDDFKIVQLALERKYNAEGWFSRYHLDFRSKFFRPTFVLYEKNVQVPVKGIAPLDNIAKAPLLLPETNLSQAPKTRTGRLRGEAKQEFVDRKAAILAQRRIFAERYIQHLADRHRKGPLSLLHKFLKDSTRIRATIRKVNGVQGFVTGFLKGFDKHCNMLLIDVDETCYMYQYEYIPLETSDTKRHKIVHIPITYVEAQADAQTNPSEELPPGWIQKTCGTTGRSFYYCSLNGFSQWHRPTPIIKKKFERIRTRVERNRHFNQTILRGDCVVVIGKDMSGNQIMPTAVQRKYIS